jgi:hypothetical protein
MSTTHACTTCGAASATSDYCDVCGAAIADPSSDPADPVDSVDPAAVLDIPPPPSAAARREESAPGAAGTCYFCGAPRAADDELCDVCGIDFVSGQGPAAATPTPLPPPPPPMPEPVPMSMDTPPGGNPPVPDSPVVSGTRAAGARPVDTTFVTDSPMPDLRVAGAPSTWTAVVGADRAFFDGNVTAGVVSFPDPVVPRYVPLTGEVSIGRRSESKGYHPDIDLASPVDDPAVSRRHAVLQRMPDGSLEVVDMGSTNGTWVNDEDEPLAHGVPRTLRDGDRLLLGAFTCITIRGEPTA